nr:TolC family protein [uncultured Muribaculum sp.]
MKLIHKLTLTLTLLSVLLAAATAQSQPLTLDTCRQMALRNNIKIRTAKNAVNEAKELRNEAFTKYFPQVNASGFAFKSNKGLVQFGLLDILSVSFFDKSINAGITAVQPIFMGGQIVNSNKPRSA